MSLYEGARVGPFLIERRLGAGAFGAVWCALNQQTGQRVAIKTLLRGQDDSAAEHIARFRREAVNLRRVQSDYVARLLDFVVDEHEGMLLVMEYIEGELLADVLQDTNLSLPEAIELGIHLARGLTDMHAAGVIHRDIKPSNIMIRPLPSGMQRAVIFDLGLSRFNPTEAIPDDRVDGDVTATASRVAIGTPAYMAPEQVLDARRATEASDVYATGVVLYLAVSGRYPYSGDERSIANQKLMSEALPVDVGRHDELGMRFVEVIAKAIRRRPEERYQGGPQLLQALDELRVLERRLAAERAAAPASVYPAAMSPRSEPPPQLMPMAPPSLGEPDRRAQGAYILAAVAGGLALAIVLATYLLRR